MTARSVFAGSQPAIDLECDVRGCTRTSRHFVDRVRQAREDARNLYGWGRLYVGTQFLDACDTHTLNGAGAGS